MNVVDDSAPSASLLKPLESVLREEPLRRPLAKVGAKIDPREGRLDDPDPLLAGLGRLCLGGVRLAVNEEFHVLVDGLSDVGALQDDLLALVLGVKTSLVSDDATRSRGPRWNRTRKQNAINGMMTQA
jgi:hypothetical protein